MGATATVDAAETDYTYSGGLLYLSGDFTHVEGVERGGIARLLSGHVDANWNIAVNGPVSAIAVDGLGAVYLAGDFSPVNSVSVPSLARLKPDGAVDGAFHPPVGGARQLYALALDGGDLYVAGHFAANAGACQGQTLADYGYAIKVDAGTGTIDCDGLGGRLAIEAGWFNLLVDAGGPRHRRMEYRLHARDAAGRPVTLLGFKDVQDNVFHDPWADTSTLDLVVFLAVTGLGFGVLLTADRLIGG